MDGGNATEYLNKACTECELQEDVLAEPFEGKLLEQNQVANIQKIEHEKSTMANQETRHAARESFRLFIDPKVDNRHVAAAGLFREVIRCLWLFTVSAEMKILCWRCVGREPGVEL